MNYSPDYNMRRRNQECGCNRNTPRPGSRTAECGRGEAMPPKQENHRPCLDAYPIGMTYVPWQVWQELYNLEEGFSAGTIFRELDYPWEVGRCAKCQ